MSAAIASALLVLALLDGAFSGFRSSVGRTGLVNHRASDTRANQRGAALVTVLLVPVVALASCAAAADHRRAAAFTRAGRVMLAIYGPYAALVLAALAVYALLGWRQRYLASAVILGPFTLLRPIVAVAGAVAAALVCHDLVVAVSAVLATVAVLACEPLADRLWYDGPRQRKGRE
jgi:low temperature requirement protein LtrA